MKEKIIFLAQTYAPNPSECTYWIDLKEDPTGAVIKVWNGATWKPISGDTEVVAMLQEEIKKKATKATTLSGYGIQDAYTKDQVDAKVASVYRVKGSVADLIHYQVQHQLVMCITWMIQELTTYVLQLVLQNGINYLKL